MAAAYAVGTSSAISSHDEEGYDSENGVFIKPTKAISRQAPSGNKHNNNKVRLNKVLKTYQLIRI